MVVMKGIGTCIEHNIIGYDTWLGQSFMAKKVGKITWVHVMLWSYLCVTHLSFSCIYLVSLTMCTTGLLFHFYWTYFELSCYLNT
jgi:hypothetical protein